MIVAFVAGLIALAMPCCFSVLLPSYFAQSFKQKTRLVAMTLVFSAGIATIMLPIALGIVAIAQTVTANHSLVFVIGGFVMILLGFWTLWGQGMLPMLNFPVNLNRNNVASVYTLGVFSGAATSCCAPVLAGVLVLAALSTGMIEGLLIGFTYIAGMVFPLFAIALIWDKYAATGGNPLRGRMLTLNLFGREMSIHSSKLIAGVLFVTMGIATVILGLTGTMIPTPGSAFIGVVRSQLEESLVSFFANAGMIEVAVLVGGALTIMICLVYAIGRFRKTRLMVSAGKSSWFHRTLNLSRPQSRLDDGGGAK
jgi:cytochrome c biogenesis protein CcdA